ncbi:MAG: hypothetical protein ACJA1A_000637 [Saprospiraceae bacterium]|jgi:hypothetical protein
MKIRFITYIFFICFSSISMKMIAQTGPATAPVVYEVIYNTSTCLYEAHAHVQSGALAFPLTIPFPSNFTIVIPESFPNTPISAVSNQPPSLAWTNSNNVYNPSADPVHDFHMFSISGGGAGQAYTTFAVGDDILLFTFSLPHTLCEEGIRVFINGTDPDSGAPGMGGLDLSNSLKTVNPAFPQGSEQYTANINNSGVILPKPTANPSFDCSNTEIELFANPNIIPNCLGPLTFEWTGPNAYQSTEENPSIAVTDAAAQSGEYALTVTDANGCTFDDSFDITAVNCFLLPIELLSFEANKNQDNVLLIWVTANEINNDYFDIQKSDDGVNFTTIGTVQGGGTVQSESRYSFIDKEPNRDNYYRLMQVDFDGKSDLSDLRYVAFEDGRSSDFMAYPNPFSNSISLTLVDGIYNVKIYAVTGELKGSSVFTAGDQISTSQLNIGTYIIKVENSLGVQVLNQIIIKS